MRDGRTDRALAQVDRLIASAPDDPRWPFEQALLLTSQKRSAEAIAVYERLTRAHPSTIEAWNNLGVLYAGAGELEKARAAFERALQCQQAARVAYANLGHVSLRLAGGAYARALHIDGGPKTLVLTPLERLPEPMAAAVAPAPAPAALPMPLPSVVASIASDPVATAPARSPATVRAPAASAPTPAEPPSTAARAVAPKPALPTAAPRPPAPAPLPTPATDTAVARDVQAAVAAWAAAWSRKDMEAYVAAYVPGYKGSDANASAWQAARRVRILGKSRIAVGVSRVAIELRAENAASASFRQSYVADQLNVGSSKTLDFVKLNGRWLIRKETAGS